MWFCWLTFSILCLYQGQRDNVMCTMFDVSTFPRWNEWASNSASFHVIPPEQTCCVILSMNLTLNVFNINYQICVKGDKTRTHKSRSVVRFRFPACDDGLKELKITKKHWSWTCHLVQHLLSALSSFPSTFHWRTQLQDYVKASVLGQLLCADVWKAACPNLDLKACDDFTFI